MINNRYYRNIGDIKELYKIEYLNIYKNMNPPTCCFYIINNNINIWNI